MFFSNSGENLLGLATVSQAMHNHTLHDSLCMEPGYITASSRYVSWPEVQPVVTYCRFSSKRGGGGNVYLCTITNVTEVHPSVKYQYPVNVKGFTSDFI